MKFDTVDTLESATAGTAVEAPSTTAFNPIPGEHDRPRHVVLDDLHTTSDGSKYRAGVWYFGIKPSKGDSPPALVQSWICSPLHVDAVTYDNAGANFGRLLRFRNTLGQWKTWSMPMEMLKGDASDLRGVLLSMGVHMDSGNAGDVLAKSGAQSPYRGGHANWLGWRRLPRLCIA